MSANGIRIDELRLAIPGLTREQAYRLGQDVAQRLGSDLPSAVRRQQLGELSLRLQLQPGMPPERLAQEIAIAIKRSLR